jgi:hypothetical protein
MPLVNPESLLATSLGTHRGFILLRAGQVISLALDDLQQQICLMCPFNFWQHERSRCKPLLFLRTDL